MSLQATLLQNIRSNYERNLDKYEDRLSEYGALVTFQNDTVDPESIVRGDVLEKASQSIGNTLQIPVIDGGDITISNVRSCVIPDFENTSGLVTVTFATYTAGFSMVPGQYDNNDIGYQADLERKILKLGKSYAQVLDTASITKLDADKTAIMNSSLVGAGTIYGALVGDAIQVSAALTPDFYNDLSTIMNEDDFEGNYNVIGSQGVRRIVNKFSNQGTSNDVNREFQFGPYSYAYSNRVTVAASANAAQYVMPKGSLATLVRNTPDAMAGRVVNEGEFFDIFEMPYANIPVGLHYKKACADNSGVAGGSQDYLAGSVKESWGFDVDVAFITAYNSDPATLAGAIHKADFLNA